MDLGLDTLSLWQGRDAGLPLNPSLVVFIILVGKLGWTLWEGRATVHNHMDLHLCGTFQNLPTHVSIKLLNQAPLVLEHFGEMLCQ